MAMLTMVPVSTVEQEVAELPDGRDSNASTTREKIPHYILHHQPRIVYAGGACPAFGLEQSSDRPSRRQFRREVKESRMVSKSHGVVEQH